MISGLSLFLEDEHSCSAWFQQNPLKYNFTSSCHGVLSGLQKDREEKGGEVVKTCKNLVTLGNTFKHTVPLTRQEIQYNESLSPYRSHSPFRHDHFPKHICLQSLESI